DREVCNLIFLPGFSTAEKVSNISGRGVGMDVVRTNIEKIGGVVDITSIEGHGSTMRLKIPLTLAIVPALLVKTDGQCFAIPQVKLTELVRLQRGDDHSENRIEYLQGQAVFRLRGRLLPLLSLEELLGLKTDKSIPLKEREDISIVVLQADSGVFGLIVDEIDDSTDIVVKSLSGFLKNLSVYSGATVLGDGSVALVLDVIGLADHANIFKETREIESHEMMFANTQREEITEYLLVDVALEGKYCIPLYVVNRLEEFPTSALEFTGDQIVVRYRGSILPLINVPTTIGAASSGVVSLAKRNYCSVIVVQQSDRLYGLVVDQILDIIGLSGPINEQVRNKDCLLGTKIHGTHVVSVIDAFKVIDKHFPLIQTKSETREILSTRPVRILYAEDSEFFQKQIANMLKIQGFKIVCVSSGEEAYNRLMTDGPDAFDVVVSDLDMPVLDGFGFMEKLRAAPGFKNLPALALSSRAKSLTEKLALRSGFDAFIEKSDATRLIDSINHYTQTAREVKRGA
ncbi:MAG: response regulator, partial [Proteobacteria bacterium]